MGDNVNDDPETLLDYDEEETEPEQQANGNVTGSEKKTVKGNYVSIHSSGFRDFLLKPELLRAIVDSGFEHPSEGKIFRHVSVSAIFYGSAIFCHPSPQFKMNVSLSLFWVWMLSAKPRVVWARQQFL